ncbi:MAG: amidohydrolase family protein, partial [Bacteroidales bacterium]
MKRLHISLLILMLVLCGEVTAQTSRLTGLRENTPSVFALTNAEIVTEPGSSLSGATMVVRDGTIEAVGRRISIPSDATVIDMEGKKIYPGFIDLFAQYGLPTPEGADNIHWNQQIRAHYSSAEDFTPDEETASVLRGQGFVAVQTLPAHGLFRGYGSITTLGSRDANRELIRADHSQMLSFRRSRELRQSYPTSGMGAISLIRQTLLDAEWYREAHNAYNVQQGLERPETNRSLEAIDNAIHQEMPFIMEAEDENWVMRSHAMASEFGLNVWIRGSGHEYRALESVSETGRPLILPLNFPDAPNVASPEDARRVSLEALRHWYFAPENPARVAESGIPMALTAYGSNKNFLDNLKTAVERGLSPENALRALTTTPASMLGIDNRYGSLSAGKAASFIVADKDLFDHNSEILQVWIDGQEYKIKPDRNEPGGQWLISGREELMDAVINIEGRPGQFRGTITMGDQSVRLMRIRIENNRLYTGFPGESLGLGGIIRLSANLGSDELLGAGETSDGEFFTWKASRIEPAGEGRERTRAPFIPLNLPERYPSVDYGLTAIPEQPDHLLVQNATIWTQGEEGIIENADMLITDGRIAAVGFNIDAPRRATVIDAGGRHVTPGLIDPHIHSSIAGGVNETGDAITSETRIQDVMDANNVWIYRLLAGGTTSAKLFHGSANPIGGQDAAMKMRWGHRPDELLIEDAFPGLKMALGENVKRMGSRYPSSRQGTEQIIKDAFQAAVEYGKAWERWENDPTGIPPRRDLQLEPILEVINGERKAHVHAYRQDEMLMMIRVGDEFGFTVGTFEHGLEAYKIADE